MVTRQVCLITICRIGARVAACARYRRESSKAYFREGMERTCSLG